MHFTVGDMLILSVHGGMEVALSRAVNNLHAVEPYWHCESVISQHDKVVYRDDRLEVWCFTEKAVTSCGLQPFIYHLTVTFYACDILFLQYLKLIL